MPVQQKNGKSCKTSITYSYISICQANVTNDDISVISVWHIREPAIDS